MNNCENKCIGLMYPDGLPDSFGTSDGLCDETAEQLELYSLIDVSATVRKHLRTLRCIRRSATSSAACCLFLTI